jgi:uncharacterized damage-inducible protein DinB
MEIPGGMSLMTEHERQKILVSLEKGSATLHDTLQGLTDELAARVPGLGKWSILQCVEHVAVSEGYLLSQILASQHADSPMINEQREALISARGADRTRRIESPEEARPAERFSTLSQAVQHFLASRERTIQFVKANEEDLRSMITSHPLFGSVNCCEVLLLMAVHPARHATQIEEIKTAKA